MHSDLDPVHVCFLLLVGKQYTLKAVRTLEKRKKQRRKKNYSVQTEPTWERIRPSLELIQFFERGAMSIQWEAPGKGAPHRRRGSEELNLNM